MSTRRDMLDEEQLAELREDLGDAFADFVGSFLDSMRAAMGDLGSALEAGDLDAIAQHAHRLKGTAGYLGTAALAGQLGLLESAARDGDAVAAGRALEALREAFTSVEPRLRGFLRDG